MKQALIIFVTFLIFITSAIAQPKKIIHPANIFSEGNFYIDDTELLSDAIVVKFKEKVITSDDTTKSFSQRINSKFQNTLNVLKEIEKKAGKIRLDKSIKNADPNNLKQINKRTGLPVTIKDLSQVYHLRFDNPVSVTEVINQLKDLPEVEYAHQPATIVFNYSPNDPMFTSPGQWNLTAVQATNAWNINTGSSSVCVGLVDQGVNYSHEDLQGKCNRTDGTITGPHGTWVAGVAGVKTNNSLGIAGLGFNIKLNSYNLDNSVANAIDMCARYSDIINMSFGTAYVMSYNDLVEIGCPPGKAANQWVGSLKPYNYGEVEDVVANAVSQGIICVASAGNKSMNSPRFDLAIEPDLCDCSKIPYVSFPAAYSGVIAVSGTLLYQGVEQFVDGWNYGSFVDVSAPGKNILTTDYPSGYISVDGTSFSAPLTAALCGLLLSLNSSLTVQQITNYITNSTDKIDAAYYPYNEDGWNQYLGYGRINAYRAVQPPSAPQNPSYIVVNGHPRLSWSAGEWDVKLYEIWRDLGQGYVKIAEVNAPVTTYNDYDLIISASNPYSAWYYVKANDLTNLTSAASSALRVHYSGLQKEGLEIVQIPTIPTLYQNYPNPFNPTTTIKYSVPEEQFVSIKLYNSLGQEIVAIVEEVKQAGFYQIKFDASYLPSGIYFYNMKSRNIFNAQKMILQK